MTVVFRGEGKEGKRREGKGMEDVTGREKEKLEREHRWRKMRGSCRQDRQVRVRKRGEVKGKEKQQGRGRVKGRSQWCGGLCDPRIY